MNALEPAGDRRFAGSAEQLLADFEENVFAACGKRPYIK
jgi:hypothetical protein